MKRLVKFLLIIAALVGAERVYHRYSDGFEIGKISSNVPHNTTYSSSLNDNVVSALNQPFSYLASGSQSFCFISKDKRYVLKFFKHSRWSPKFYHAFLPVSYRKALVAKKGEAREATFESVLNALSDFQLETGLIAIQLGARATIATKVDVTDGLGRRYTIDLSGADFVLQQYAIPTPDYLLECKKNADTNKAVRAIDELFELIAHRRVKGYNDKDPNLIKNFGFIDDTATQLDVGGFHIDPVKDYDYFKSHELPKIRKKMMPWITKHYPELIPHIDRKISELTERFS